MGVIAVVDFYVSRKYPAPEPAPESASRARHSYLQRSLWPYYFSHDDVRLSADHLPYLLSKVEPMELVEAAAPLPYLGLLLPPVPYYYLVGVPRGAVRQQAKVPAATSRLAVATPPSPTSEPMSPMA